MTISRLNIDVLRLILDAFRDLGSANEVSRSNRRDLAALARTCRMLYEPAMSLLWSVLDDISPLIKCMPASAWTMGNMPLGRGLKQLSLFLAKPVPSDWDHFAKHAFRVRSLTLSTRGPSNTLISGFLLSTLCTFLQARRHLFLRLRTLVCDLYTNDCLCLACIPWLAGPYLSLLHLQSNPTPAEVANYLCPLPDALIQVQENYPLLHYINIRLGPDKECPVAVSAGVSQVLESFHMSEVSNILLNIPLQKGAIQHFSRIASLTTLEISLANLLPTDIESLGALPFTALTKLTLTVGETNTATALLDSVRNARLQTLKLDLNSRCTDGKVSILCVAIGSHRYLEHLTMNFHERPTDTRMRICRFDLLVTILPLLDLSRLRHFILQGVVRVDIFDDYLIHLGKAWPCLQELILYPFRSSDAEPIDYPETVDTAILPSFGAVRLVPEFFPQLRVLGLSIDKSAVTAEYLRQPDATQTNLYALILDTPELEFDPDLLGPIEFWVPSLREIAQFLYEVFPQLITVMSPHPIVSDSWCTKVDEYLLEARRGTDSDTIPKQYP